MFSLVKGISVRREVKEILKLRTTPLRPVDSTPVITSTADFVNLSTSTCIGIHWLRYPSSLQSQMSLRSFKNRLEILRSMVARRTPRFPYRPHLILSEILKGLEFKPRSRDRHYTRFVRIFNPWCGTRHSRRVLTRFPVPVMAVMIVDFIKRFCF